MEPIKLNGCKLNPEALNLIADYQDDNNHGFATTKENLSEMLIIMIQEGFGNEKRNTYIATMADVIQLINSLKG